MKMGVYANYGMYTEQNEYDISVIIQWPRYGSTEQEWYWIQCLQKSKWCKSCIGKPWILNVDCSEESLDPVKGRVSIIKTRKWFVVTWFIIWPFSGCSHMTRHMILACRDRVYGQPGGHLEVLCRWSNGCTEVHRWVAHIYISQCLDQRFGTVCQKTFVSQTL